MVSLYRNRGKKGSFWPNFFQKTPGKAQKVPEKARKEPKNAWARPGGAERRPSKSVFDSGDGGESPPERGGTMWKEIFWVFPAGRKGCRRGRGQERLVWEAPRGWGPARRKGFRRGGGWRDRRYFREGPRREEKAAERWSRRGRSKRRFGEGAPPRGRSASEVGAGRGRRGWCFGKGGRWEEGTWRGGGRETTVRVLPWKGRPPGGGGSGEVGLEGWVRMVLRGEGARWEEGAVEGRDWRGASGKESGRGGQRKGAARRRLPVMYFFTAAFSAALPGFPGGGRRGPRPAR